VLDQHTDSLEEKLSYQWFAECYYHHLPLSLALTPPTEPHDNPIATHILSHLFNFHLLASFWTDGPGIILRYTNTIKNCVLKEQDQRSLQRRIKTVVSSNLTTATHFGDIDEVSVEAWRQQCIWQLKTHNEIKYLDELEHSSSLYESQVIEMLRCYWLEVRVVFADKTTVAATAKSSSPSSAMFLIWATWTVWH